MTDGKLDFSNAQVDEHVVLQKFDGEAHPDNLIERLTIDNGTVVLHEKIENGEVVASNDHLVDYEGGDPNATN